MSTVSGHDNPNKRQLKLSYITNGPNSTFIYKNTFKLRLRKNWHLLSRPLACNKANCPNMFRTKAHQVRGIWQRNLRNVCRNVREVCCMEDLLCYIGKFLGNCEALLALFQCLTFLNSHKTNYKSHGTNFQGRTDISINTTKETWQYFISNLRLYVYTSACQILAGLSIFDGCSKCK